MTCGIGRPNPFPEVSLNTGASHPGGAIRFVPIATAAALLISAPAPAAISSRILDAPTVLQEHTRIDGSRRFLVAADGTQWELVTDVKDAAIQNPGSGSFCPAGPEVVQEALDDVSADLGAVTVSVFILPFPRRNLMTSSADHGVIYLSPGVYPYTAEQVHALVVHELGHIVHQTFLPDGDARWNTFRAIRGLTDASRYNETVEHRNRPHEIFAEDFRVLFGGALANYSGTIENPDLDSPLNVAGLQDFMVDLTLAGRGSALPLDPGLVSTPNPFRPETTIRFTVAGHADVVVLDIVNVQGQMVRHLVNGQMSAGDHSVVWNGNSESGESVAAGLYFASITSGTSRSILKLIRTR